MKSVLDIKAELEAILLLTSKGYHDAQQILNMLRIVVAGIREDVGGKHE